MKFIRRNLLGIILTLALIPSIAIGAGTLWINGVEQTSGGTILSPTIVGGTIDNTIIGGTTPAAGTFTKGVIIPSATEQIALDIQGETNDYTGAGASVGFRCYRDINRGTGAIANNTGWQSYLQIKHTDAKITNDMFAYGSITRVNSTTSSRLTNEGATDYQYWETGAHNTSKGEIDLDTDSTGILKYASIGTYSWVYSNNYNLYDTGGTSPANTLDAFGYVSKVENRPTFHGTADATVQSAGLYISDVTGNAYGTSTAYGILIGAVTGADTNYGIYEASGQKSVFEGSLQANGLYTENGATSAGSVYFYEDSDNGANTCKLIGPASTADVIQTLQAVTGTVLCTGGTDVPIADGGTGQSTAANAFGVLKQDATDAATGVVEYATDAETIAGVMTDRATTPANLNALLAASGGIPPRRYYPATLDDGTTPHALTVAEVTNTLITTQGWNGTTDIEFTLPDISAYDGSEGVLKVKFLDSKGMQDADTDMYINPDDSTQIALDGTITGTDGHRVWNDNTPIYSSIICHSDYDPTLGGYWVCDSINGIWADKGS